MDFHKKKIKRDSNTDIKMNGLGLIILIIAIIVGIYAFNSCKLSCTQRDGYTPRGAVHHALLDNFNARTTLPSFDVKYPIHLESLMKDEMTRENYHGRTGCEMHCRNEIGNTPRSLCINRCIAANIGEASDVDTCYHNLHCGADEICVKGGPYSGLIGGLCMNANEPGVIESFAAAITCAPEEFFNEVAGRCEPRFQGSSSAYAVMHPRALPDPIVTIPGSVRRGFGVGRRDPKSIITDYIIN